MDMEARGHSEHPEALRLWLRLLTCTQLIEKQVRAELRERFPDVPFQAFTATATPRVREDIVTQLGLAAPEVFVASFNRPNLTYRVVAKDGAARQVVFKVGITLKILR
jgi:hypothetical protein